MESAETEPRGSVVARGSFTSDGVALRVAFALLGLRKEHWNVLARNESPKTDARCDTIVGMHVDPPRYQDDDDVPAVTEGIRAEGNTARVGFVSAGRAQSRRGTGHWTHSPAADDREHATLHQPTAQRSDYDNHRKRSGRGTAATEVDPRREYRD